MEVSKFSSLFFVFLLSYPKNFLKRKLSSLLGRTGRNLFLKIVRKKMSFYFTISLQFKICSSHRVIQRGFSQEPTWWYPCHPQTFFSWIWRLAHCFTGQRCCSDETIPQWWHPMCTTDLKIHAQPRLPWKDSGTRSFSSHFPNRFLWSCARAR